jgi:putative acetyltransferase
MAKARSVVTVRRAEVRDAEALCATFGAPKSLAGTLQMPMPSVELWRKRIADVVPEDYFLVAEVGGEVVGNAGLHANRGARRRHAGHIGMSVRDDWHGKGVGSALMAAIVDIADNWINYRRLELTVYTDNVAALALYRKFGFTIEGTLRDYSFRNGSYVDAYTMARLRPDAVQRKATRTSRKRR